MLLTKKAVAARLGGLSITMINRLMRDKPALPSIKLGRRVLFSPEAVDSWLAAHAVRTAEVA